MNDFEINKALALAIGWAEYNLSHSENKILFAYRHGWNAFDYRDWRVAGPIAERYDCYPMLMSEGWWSVIDSSRTAFADTPQKAIALAVIGAKK